MWSERRTPVTSLAAKLSVFWIRCRRHWAAPLQMDQQKWMWGKTWTRSFRTSGVWWWRILWKDMRMKLHRRATEATCTSQVRCWSRTPKILTVLHGWIFEPDYVIWKSWVFFRDCLVPTMAKKVLLWFIFKLLQLNQFWSSVMDFSTRILRLDRPMTVGGEWSRSWVSSA